MPDEDGIENENDIDFNNPVLKEKLLIIQEACASMDKKSAKEALMYLKEMKWSKNIRNKLSSISERLLHSEFDEVAAIARDLLS
jgi:hypothetical protein